MGWWDNLPPWKAWQQQRREEVVKPQEQERLCKALRVETFARVKDVLNSLLLAECVYKVHDHGPQFAVKAVNEIKQKFPPGLLNIQSIQCSLPHVHHRYLVADSPDTVYVSFIGTKLAKDVLVDANFFHEPLWKGKDAEADLPAVHRGFLDRARKVPMENLLSFAQRQNKKLLLTGHSLGGAIANLSTLKALQQASDAHQPQPQVSCVTFGTPAIGNAALSGKVSQQGWSGHFHHVVLPEDLIPRLLSLRPQETLQELTSTLEEAPQKMHPNKQGWVFGIGDRWRPGLFRRQNPTGQPQSSLVGQSIDGEETQATFPPDRKQTSTETLPPSGPPKFVTAVVKPVSARAASLKAFAQKAPERLWHRHKVVQVTLFTPPLLFRPNFFLRRKSQSPLTGAHNLSVQPAYRISDQVVSGAVDAYYRGYNSMHRGKQQNSASTEKEDAESSGSGNEEGEDGAVDVLMKAAEPQQPKDTNNNFSAEQSQSWTQHLWDVQKFAVSAASAVGNVPQILPSLSNRIHFGKSTSWEKIAGSTGTSEGKVQDARSWILANHRMPAYRARALAICLSILHPPPSLEDVHDLGEVVTLSDSLVPRLQINTASGQTIPHIPSTSLDQNSGRWAWVPYFGQGANSQQKHPMEVLIEGTGLEWLKQGRLHAFHSTWLPVRLKPGLQDPNTKIAKPDAGRNSGRTEWPLGWFSAQKDNALESVEAEAQLPNAVALQVCNNSHRLDESDMVLHLRSDFEAVTVPLQVKLPKVYIIGTSISAARRMISVLGQQDQNPTLQSKSVQPAEIALDGIRWCNLLAAPAATPKLATAALTLSLASQKRGFAETWGPVKLASKWIEGMQMWLAAPRSSHDVDDGLRAILIANDGQFNLPQRHITRLMAQAKASDTPVLVANLQQGGSQENSFAFSLSEYATSLSQNDQSSSIFISLKNANEEELLSLRREVHNVLSRHHLAPLSKL